MNARPSFVELEVPLAHHTTLEVGGPARAVARVEGERDVSEALAWARREGLPWVVLGGGSNLLVADAGFPGLVISLLASGWGVVGRGVDAVEIEANGGMQWDRLVAETVGAGLVGLECLSGIPGSVGAAPIQNIGAYGAELAEVCRAVRVFDVATGQASWRPAADCGFAYRTSWFRRNPGRAVVLSVRFALRAGGGSVVRYPELAAALPHGAPDAAAVRETVLQVRSTKSMVWRADDPNRRSAGSFFLNPIVAPAVADEVAQRAARDEGRPMPRWPQADGGVKLSAAWLIERAGLSRGWGRGRVGLSTRHTLAIVNRGGATAAEIVSLAAEVRGQVRARLGVTLQPEPVFLGFDGAPDALLSP